MRCLAVLVLLHAAVCLAQIPVHFVNGSDRFVVFANDRFEHLEPRPPKQVIVQDGVLVYLDNDGKLKVFLPEGRRLHLLDQGGVSALRAAQGTVAWMKEDTLKVLSGDRPQFVAMSVDSFKVSAGLITFTSAMSGQFMAYDGGELRVLGTLHGVRFPVYWEQEGRQAVFRMGAGGPTRFYRDGSVTELLDLDPGAPIHVLDGSVNYWNTSILRYVSNTGMKETVISEAIPLSARTGAGIIALEDADGRFQCFMGDSLHTIITEHPSAYWVKDSVLLFLRYGELFQFGPDGWWLVEPYIPEQWEVNGSLLVYLDIDRGIQGVQHGERIPFGRDSGVEEFKLFGDAVLYKSPFGHMTVVRDGKMHPYLGDE